VIPESLPPAVSPLWKDQQNIPIGLFEKRIKRKAYFHSNEEQFSNPKEFWSTARHHYFADIVHLDEQVGKILDTIEKTGRSGGSYIILTADHGDMLGDHGFFGKGWPHYDSCIRIPMIISGPKLQKGQIRHELVQLEDVFYTILEMAGNLSSNTCSVETTREAELYWAPGSHAKYVHTPQPNLPRQSRSMLSMCRGEHVADWRKSVYIESYDEPLGDAWTRTIRSEKHRYTYFPRGGGEQLFYLASDPDEIRNIAGDAGSREIVKQMRNELLEKIIEQDYPCTVRDCRILGMY